MKMLPKLYIGPMSKNVVDVVIEFNGKVGLIPSRRQIDWDSGYVNDWTTSLFTEYVNGATIIERDHGGPNQGKITDTGVVSFTADVHNLNIVHVDP
jgi:hypothetical protein